MQKIVINRCYGGYGLSDEAAKLLGFDDPYEASYKIERDDSMLVQVVEQLGSRAGGRHSVLEVIEIPEGVDWIITDYDGYEQVEEKHRVWP